MRKRLSQAARPFIIAALRIVGLVIAALWMLARGSESSRSPLVLRAGENAPVSCLNGTLRIEPNNFRLIVIYCGNPLIAPRPSPVAEVK